MLGSLFGGTSSNERAMSSQREAAVSAREAAVAKREAAVAKREAAAASAARTSRAAMHAAAQAARRFAAQLSQMARSNSSVPDSGGTLEAGAGVLTNRQESVASPTSVPSSSSSSSKRSRPMGVARGVVSRRRHEQAAAAKAMQMAGQSADPCADEWHTSQCKVAVPHASDRYRGRILETSGLPWGTTFKHTHGFPMYATNAAILSLAATHLLSPVHPEPVHLIRITPLALSCSPMDLGEVLRTRYAENSHGVLVSGLGGSIGSDGATSENGVRVLRHFSNTEDPRGLLHGGFLWIFYTTTLKIYYPGKVCAPLRSRAPKPGPAGLLTTLHAAQAHTGEATRRGPHGAAQVHMARAAPASMGQLCVGGQRGCAEELGAAQAP